MSLNMKAPTMGRASTTCRAQRVVSVPTCSLKEKISEVAKKTVATITATTMFAGVAHAGLTYDQLQSLTYMQVKGTGIANTCPIIDGGSDNPKDLKSGSYKLTKFCMEPTSFKVKEEGEEEFEKTRLLTRLTYTLDAMEGTLNVSGSNVTLTEEEGLDFAPVTVQLGGGERVPFLFTVKELKASGPIDGGISGKFLVPSYRGSTFLDPKGRGGSTGYDTAVALPAGSDSEEYANVKRTDSAEGEAIFSIAKVDPGTGEVAGVFETVQPSDTDLGAKAPKEVKTTGIWYARLN